jgi:hypothetical protein
VETGATYENGKRWTPPPVSLFLPSLILLWPRRSPVKSQHRKDTINNPREPAGRIWCVSLLLSSLSYKLNLVPSSPTYEDGRIRNRLCSLWLLARGVLDGFGDEQMGRGRMSRNRPTSRTCNTLKQTTPSRSRSTSFQAPRIYRLWIIGGNLAQVRAPYPPPPRLSNAQPFAPDTLNNTSHNNELLTN